jgi:hypothetical protein
MAVWIGAVLMVGGLWSASAISQGLADEPAAPSRSSEATGGAAGKETGGSEAGPPVGEGEPGPPPEAGEVQERGVIRPGVTGPLTAPLALPDTYIAPTLNLTAVANGVVEPDPSEESDDTDHVSSRTRGDESGRNEYRVLLPGGE